MKMNRLILLMFLVVSIGTYIFFYNSGKENTRIYIDSTPKNVILSGVYVCLPHVDTSGPQTQECAFGLKTDDDVYYAVNFGQSADAMQRFQGGESIVAEGFVVPKEALSSDHWYRYNIKGVFTVTKFIK